MGGEGEGEKIRFDGLGGEIMANVQVFITKTNKFRARIMREDEPEYEVTVGGWAWEHGKGREFEGVIKQKVASKLEKFQREAAKIGLGGKAMETGCEFKRGEVVEVWDRKYETPSKKVFVFYAPWSKFPYVTKGDSDLHEAQVLCAYRNARKPRPELEMDAKVLVKQRDDKAWVRRHFAGWSGDKILTWERGMTSWTRGNFDPFPWNQWKLPDEEEE